MKMSQLLGRRDKDAPKEAQIISHQLMLRGGYIRQVGAGLYSILPLGLRVLQKIESIIREEMNAVGGQEILMPVVLPRELWEESGRYDSVGSELLRFKDRTGKDFVLGMTHEEAVVHLARSEIFSYKQLPLSVYQVQTKFRDEPRARGGLIRVREFTMKDAYSFHADEDCLKKTYEAYFQAYERVFKRVGLKNFISVESDAGMMGGGCSHEFMSVLDIGEDSFLICNSCDYKANREVATTVYPAFNDEGQTLEEVSTPGTKTIEEVSSLLNVSEQQTAKAIFYKDDDGKLVVILTRGDLDVNEAKLKVTLGMSELVMADDELITRHGMVPGFASPLNTDAGQYRLLVDLSLKNRKGLITGANKADAHMKGFDSTRDLEKLEHQWVDLSSVPDKSTCPHCKKGELDLKRGVEIGNIFQLGDKYTKSMKMDYLDKNGKAQTPIMGCYGIGVGRLMACVLEESHDKFGPIWPERIAPFQVHINVLDPKKEGVLDKAMSIYTELVQKGVDVLIDDRGEKAGFQFSDADLLGCPHRLIISPKNLAKQKVEYRTRAIKDSTLIDTDQIVSEVLKQLK